MLTMPRLQRLLPLTIFVVIGLLLFPNAPRLRVPSFTSPFRGAAGSLLPVPEAGQADAERCDLDIAHLGSLGLSAEILYTRRCIKPFFDSHVDRDAVAKIQSPLIDSQVAINLSSCSPGRLPGCAPMALSVPPPHTKRKYPHLVFGISTTYERLEGSSAVFSHWLSASEAVLVAVVVDADPHGQPPRDLGALERLYQGSDMLLHCVRPRNSSLSVDQNHFTVILDMLEAATPRTRWLGLLDDDTFFPSLYNLDQALGAYNSEESTWLGALSEDLEAVRNWGIMAFGGAGVFLSMPLARELAPHVDECLGEARRSTGDAILRDCVFSRTHTKLTTVAGLHQHDLMGDVSGFYESGRRPLSVHHWKSWYREPVDRMAAVVDVCGDCFLQRWQFGGDTLLANGYSITRYRDLAGVDLTRTEVTWASPDGDNSNFGWSLGPFRDRVPDGQKKTYKVLDAVRAPGGGGLRQLYVSRGNAELGEKDEVVELVWTV